MSKNQKITASATVKPTAKVKAPRVDVFAKRLAEAKSTGRPALDAALRRICTDIHAGAKMEQVENGFVGVIGKAKITASRVIEGKAKRFSLYIGEAGKGMEIRGQFANLAYHQAAKAFKVPTAKKAVAYDAEKIEALCKDLGL